MNDNKNRDEKIGAEVQPDVTPRREGGDDAIAETSPLDSRADEMVLVNARPQESGNKEDSK